MPSGPRITSWTNWSSRTFSWRPPTTTSTLCSRTCSTRCCSAFLGTPISVDVWNTRRFRWRARPTKVLHRVWCPSTASACLPPPFVICMTRRWVYTIHSGPSISGTAIAWPPSTRILKGLSVCACSSRSCCRHTNRSYGPISESFRYSRELGLGFSLDSYFTHFTTYLSLACGWSSNGLCERFPDICPPINCWSSGIWYEIHLRSYWQ